MFMKFGKKWRGEPVREMVEQDPDYCRWLINVPAFRERHRVAYAMVREAVIHQLQLEKAVEEIL